MNKLDKQYVDLLSDILANGTLKKDRTGVGTYSVSGRMIQHNMANGFPALTTKRLYFKTMAVELEGFLKGITDKKWYQDKNCHIWDEWSNKQSMPQDLKDNPNGQELHNDLGPVYGYQWRNWNGDYVNEKVQSPGYDQLSTVLNSLKNNPTDRRMIVSAWNPLQINQMALPPCHLLWQVIVRDQYLDIMWYQRSVDTFLGLPFNIASYGLLLELLAKQFNYKPGILTGFLGDTHIYANHMEQVKIQMDRINQAYPLPTLRINETFKDVLEFDSSIDIELLNYKCHPAIKADIAI